MLKESTFNAYQYLRRTEKANYILQSDSTWKNIQRQSIWGQPRRHSYTGIIARGNRRWWGRNTGQLQSPPQLRTICFPKAYLIIPPIICYQCITDNNSCHKYAIVRKNPQVHLHQCGDFFLIFFGFFVCVREVYFFCTSHHTCLIKS